MSILNGVQKVFHQFFSIPTSIFDASKYSMLSTIIMEQRLKKQFPSLKYVEFLDSALAIMPIEDIKKLLEFNYYKEKKYTPEIYDCDNFAFSVKGMFMNIAPECPLGIAHVDTPDGKHSLNIVYDSANKKYLFLEPQTNMIFSNPKYKPYMVIF